MASTDKSNLPPAPVQTVDRDWVDPTTKPAQSLDRVIQGMEGAYGVKSTPGATGGDVVGMAYGLPQKNALFTPTDFMGTAGKTPMDPYTPGVNLAPQFGSKGTGSGSGSSGGGGKGTVVPGMSLEHPTFDTEAGVPMTLPTDAKNASRYLQAGGDVDAVLSSRLGRLVTTTAQAAWNLGKETLFDLMETLDNLDNPRKVGWLGVANVIDWADDPGGIPSWLAGKAARGAVAAASLYPKATSAVVDLVGSGIEGATGAKRTTDIGLEWLKAVAGPTEGFDRGEAVEAMGRALWDAAASGELSALAQRQSSMSAGFYGPALQRSLKAIGMDRAFMTEDGRFATIYGRDLVNASIPKEMALKLAATAGSEHERAMWYMLSTDGGREVLGAALDILVDPLWLAGPAAASKVVTIGDKAYRVSTTVLRASRVLEGTEHAADAIRVATRAALGEADAVAALTDAAAALARDAATARKQAGELKALTAAELQARVADDVKQAQEALNQMVAAYGQAGGATPAELATLRGTLREAQQELLRIAGNPERYRKAAMAAQLQAASRLEGAVGAARQVLKGAAQVKREGMATVHWGERSYSMIPGKATDFLVEKVGAPLERSIAPWTFGQLQAKALAGGGPEALTVGERMAWTVHTLHTDLGKLGGNLRRLPSASWAFLSSVLGTRYFQPWVMAAQDYMKMLGRGDAAAMERLADQLVAGGELIALKGVSPETWDNYQKALGAYFDALGARDHFIRSSMSRAVRTASEIHALRKTLAIQWEKEGKPATVTHKGKVYRVDPAWGRAEYTAQDVFDEALRHAESGDGMLEARPELRPMAAAFRQFVTELQQQTGKEAGELEQALIRVIRSYKEGMEPEKLEAVRAMLAFAVEQKESVHTALASSRLQQLYDLQNDQHQLELVLETLDDVLGKGGLSKLLKAAAGQTDDVSLTERLIRMLEDQGIQRVKAEDVSKRIIKALKTATNQKTLEDALEFASRIAEPVQPVAKAAAAAPPPPASKGLLAFDLLQKVSDMDMLDAALVAKRWGVAEDSAVAVLDALAAKGLLVKSGEVWHLPKGWEKRAKLMRVVSGGTGSVIDGVKIRTMIVTLGDTGTMDLPRLARAWKVGEQEAQAIADALVARKVFNRTAEGKYDYALGYGRQLDDLEKTGLKIEGTVTVPSMADDLLRVVADEGGATVALLQKRLKARHGAVTTLMDDLIAAGKLEKDGKGGVRLAPGVEVPKAVAEAPPVATPPPVQIVEHAVDAPVLAGVRQAREEYEALAREVEELLASDDLDPARLVKLRASALRGLQREVAAWEKAILAALEEAKTPEALRHAELTRLEFGAMNRWMKENKLGPQVMDETLKRAAAIPEALRGKVTRLFEQREKALGKLQEAHAFWQEEIEILKVWEKNQSAGRKLLQLTDLGYALRNVPEADIPAMVQQAMRGLPPDPAVLAAVKRGSAKEVMDALQAQRKAVAEGIKGSKEAQRALEAELNAQRKAYIEATEAVDKLKADLDAVEMGTVWEAPTRTANQMNINERVRRQANELERAMWQRALTIRGTASEEDWLLAAFSLLGEAQRFPDQVGNLGRRVGALPDEMQGLVSEVRTIVGQYEEWYGKTGFDFPADPVQRLKEWGVSLYVPHIAPEAELAGKGNRASQTWARGSGQGGHSATDRLMNTNIPGRRQRVLAGTLDEINAASLGHSIESSPQRILARYIAVNRAITGAEFAQALLRGEVLVKLEPQVMDDVIVAADGTSQTVKRLVEGGSVEDQALAQGLFPLFDRPNKTRDLDILLQGSAEDWARIGVTVEEVQDAVAALRRPSNTDATPFMSWLRSGTEQQSMANVMAIVLHMRAEGMGRVPGGRDILWTVEDALDSYLSQGLSRQSALRAVTQDLNKVASEAGLSQIGEEALRAFTEDKPWRLFVPARIQQSMEHVFSPLIARNGGVLSKLLYGLKDTNDLFQNFWKTWTTITATAFHTKNMMSNKLVEIMNGGLWGALSPVRNMTANSLAAAAGYKETYGSIEQAVTALREAGGPRWAFFKRSSIYKLWEQGIDLGDGVVRPLDDALDLLEEHGVQTRGFTGIGNLDEYEEAISDWAYTWRHNPLKAAWKSAKDWGPDAVMASLIYGGIGLPGMAVFLPRKFGAAAGRRLESVSRLTMFMTQLETVGNVEEAAARVQKHLFNYDDLTEVQKVWVRSLFPFFTWTQKNLLIQLEMLREAPWQFGKLHQILGVELPRISDALDQNPIANPIDANDPEQRKNLRQDQRGKYMVPLPMNDWYGKQAPIYLTNFATPQESALDLVNQLWSGDVAGYFGPLSKLAYAYLSRQDPYSGKAWESETNGAKIAQQLTILKRAGELPGIGLLFRGMHAALSEGLGISIIAPAREYDPLQRVVQNPRAAFVYGQLNPWGRVVNQLCAYLDAYQVAWHTPVSELEGGDFRVPGLLRWLRSVTGLGFTFYDPWQGDRAYERALRDEQIRIGVELGGLDKSEIPRSH